MLQDIEASGLVVVVEDDAAMRASLCTLLDVMGHPTVDFPSGEALLAAGMPRDAICLLVDVRLGEGQDGITLIEQLRARGDRTPVVVVTGHGDVPLAVRAMQAGAADFIEKPYAPDRMMEAIAEACAAGSRVASASAALASLSPREREVLSGLVRGKANKIVAHDLGIGVRTVETHRAALMEKLGARSLADVVRIAMAAGVGEETSPSRARRCA